MPMARDTMMTIPVTKDTPGLMEALPWEIEMARILHEKADAIGDALRSKGYPVPSSAPRHTRLLQLHCALPAGHTVNLPEELWGLVLRGSGQPPARG